MKEMAFGNLSQDDRFQKDEIDPTPTASGSAKLGAHEPQFKTLNQQQFGTKAPTMQELKDAKNHKIKAPNDRYRNFSLKEALKVRSALVIILTWLLVRVFEHFLGHGDPNMWYSMAFNPNTMPGSLEVMYQGGGLLAHLAGIFQVILGSICAPLMFSSWLNFLVNVVFLLLLCWCAKFVLVDDTRLIVSYFLSAFVGSAIVYSLFKIMILSLTLTSSQDSVWLQTIQQSNQGVFGLQIGLVGLWVFVLMQTMFERARIPSYMEGEKAKKERQTRTIAMLTTFLVGLVYIVVMCRPTLYETRTLKIFFVLVLVVSFIIGIVRGLSSYYTMATARQHGRLWWRDDDGKWLFAGKVYPSWLRFESGGNWTVAGD